MPTGWRPADVAVNYPVYKIDNAYDFEKYTTTGSGVFAGWCWIQLTILLLIISYLFGHLAAIGSPGIFLYGGFVFLSVYSYTDLMDGNAYSLAWEIVKNIYGVAIIYYRGDWFGASASMPWINEVMITYFILSTVITGMAGF